MESIGIGLAFRIFPKVPYSLHGAAVRRLLSSLRFVGSFDSPSVGRLERFRGNEPEVVPAPSLMRVLRAFWRARFVQAHTSLFLELHRSLGSHFRLLGGGR